MSPSITEQLAPGDAATVTQLSNGRGAVLVDGAGLVFPCPRAAFSYLRQVEADVAHFFSSKCRSAH